MRKRIVAALATCALAIGVGADSAAAQPQQSGLVNVNVGDVTILQNVGVGVAANVAANICNVQVNAAVLAQQVVQNGQPFGPVCTTGEQNAPVTITT